MSTPHLGPSAGSKFWPDGTPRHFPGNTIISFVAAQSAEAHLLARTVDHLRESVADDFVVLPPSSWHMTVFELLCDQVRDADHWSRFLDADAPLSAADEFFAERVPTVIAPSRLDMRSRCISVGSAALGVLLEPADQVTTDALHRYREELAIATGVRFPNHDSYRFHITLAYRLSPPTSNTQQQIDAAIQRADIDLDDRGFEIAQPVLTYFSDMTDFDVGSRPPGTE